MFDFLFTSHNSLSVVVVSGEHFFASDVTHVVNCKQLILEQCLVCHVSWPRHGKNLWLFNHLLWHDEHFNRQTCLVVWTQHKSLICQLAGYMMVTDRQTVYPDHLPSIFSKCLPFSKWVPMHYVSTECVFYFCQPADCCKESVHCDIFLFSRCVLPGKHILWKW